MNVVKTMPFEFEGRRYEIRVFADGPQFKVAVFFNGQRANGYTYTVDEITNIDLKMSHGSHAYDHLMELAESDVRKKYWEQYLDAVAKLGAPGKS